MPTQNNDLVDDIYTGFLEYKDEKYQFLLSGHNLKIISTSEESRKDMCKFGLKEISSGFYTDYEPPRIEQDIIIGNCNETCQNIIFIPRKGTGISNQNAILIIELEAYILCNSRQCIVERISFTGPELNRIHPNWQALEYNLEDASKFQIETKGFEYTTTDKQRFTVDSHSVEVYFGVARTLRIMNVESPIILTSNMSFEIDATDDYLFILKLWYVAKQFIQFLCYRKDVHLSEVKLASRNKDGMYEDNARIHVFNEPADEIDIKTLNEGRYIKQAYIVGHEGEILKNIADNELYLRNLPESYIMGTHIDAARFVMITAAFEWEFNRLYPNGIPKTAIHISAENEVVQKLEALISESSGKTKKIYKSLMKFVSQDTSLASKIKKIGDDYGKIINPFGQQLYSLNNEELDYGQMGTRLAAQRNHFAHGDLDKDFIGLSLLDLIFLERIIYVMQLKVCGVDDSNIQKAINELFHCGLEL